MRILSRRYCKNFSSKIYLQSTVQIGFSQTGDQNWLQLQNPSLVYYSWYHTVGFFGDTTTKTKSLLFKKEKNKLLFKKEKKKKNLNLRDNYALVCMLKHLSQNSDVNNGHIHAIFSDLLETRFQTVYLYHSDLVLVKFPSKHIQLKSYH